MSAGRLMAAACCGDILAWGPVVIRARWMSWASFMSGYLAASSPLAEGITFSFLEILVAAAAAAGVAGSTSILVSSDMLLLFGWLLVVDWIGGLVGWMGK